MTNEGSGDLSSPFGDFNSTSDESYWPSAAFKALLSILRDPSLGSHHTAVVEAVMYIFRSLRLKCVAFLPQVCYYTSYHSINLTRVQVVPAFLSAMRSCPPSLQDYYIQNLGNLVATVKQHIRNHLPPILALITDYWNMGPNLQPVLVELIEQIATALDGEFKIYLPTVLPLLLQVFEADNPMFDRVLINGTAPVDRPAAGSDRRNATMKRVLRAFGIFGSNFEEYLHLTLPAIVKVIEDTDRRSDVRKSAIVALAVLCRKINFTDHASRVVHPLARMLKQPPIQCNSDLKNSAVDCLCALMTQIGPDFAIFVPMINKTLLQHKIMHQNYDSLVSKLLRGESLPQDYGLM